VGGSWRCDETYIKVKGAWMYLYRAVDKAGKTVDFYLSRHRDVAAAKAFLGKAMRQQRTPTKITLDAYAASHRAVADLKRSGELPKRVRVRSSKYPNNTIEQDHRRVKQRLGPMLGLKSFRTAAVVIRGIELAEKIKKNQFQFGKLGGPTATMPIRSITFPIRLRSRRSRCPASLSFQRCLRVADQQGKALRLRRPRSCRHIFSGRSANWILTIQDGQPFTVGCPLSTSGFGCNAFAVSSANKYANSSVAHFLNAAAFTNPPAVAAIGQTDVTPLGGSPTQVTGPKFQRLDFSLFKRFHVNDRVYLEFCSESFNTTNSPNFSNPSLLNFLDTSSFGRITTTRDAPNDPREIQFGLKLYW
jgi:hypothetical protein